MGHTTGTLGAGEIRIYRGMRGVSLIGVSVAAQSQTGTGSVARSLRPESVIPLFPADERCSVCTNPLKVAIAKPIKIFAKGIRSTNGLLMPILES